jgi:hypothetical protein
MSQAANGLINLWQTDSVPADLDSLRWVWQQVRTNGARYAEAALLIGKGEHAEAMAVIQAMPQEKDLRSREESERQRMITYINVLAGAASQGRNSYQLKDEEVQTLSIMSSQGYDRPSNWANNLLCAVYKKCRAPWTGGGASGTPKILFDEQPTTEQSSGLTIQPNPARNFTAINYTLPQDGTDGQLVIWDLFGRIIHQQRISSGQGQALMDGRPLTAGTYMVTLEVEGVPIGSERLIIQQ